MTDGRLALVTPERRWTAGQLSDAVARETERLDAAGVRDGSVDRVAFDAHATAESIVRLLALFEMGVCVAPQHPRIAAAERARRLEMLAPVLDLDAPGTRIVRGTARAGGETRWSRRPGSDPGEAKQAILFTSGSSGTPRAVVLSRRAFRSAAEASGAHLGWEPDDRWLCCLPLAHVGGLSIVVRCTTAGRPIVLTGGFDPATIVRVVAEESVTLASFVPAMLHRLFEAKPDWRAPERLRVALLGGAAAGPGLWEEIGRRGLPALATYGMTESCAQIATGTPAHPRRLVPLPGVDVRVVDGRIEVGGPTLCTAVGETVPRQDDGVAGRPDPWTPDGYLRTADLGRMEDGVLTVMGRADDVIVTGGENVAPRGVESVLEEHPAVRRAVVFGLPDEQWGALVAAVLEPSPGTARPSAAELTEWLRPRLAGFERPRRLGWVEELPTTPSGKVDRAAVLELRGRGLEKL